MDCIVIKVRQNGSVINKAVFLGLGINTEGQKALLGMWLAENEGTKFWLSVLTKLKNRGLQDILIASVDGLKAGLPGAGCVRRSLGRQIPVNQQKLACALVIVSARRWFAFVQFNQCQGRNI